MPNPLGVYARSKYMGERFVCENANRYVICRAGWMMGAGPKKDKKFLKKAKGVLFVLEHQFSDKKALGLILLKKTKDMYIGYFE